MKDKWFIAEHVKGFGPFSLDQLRALAALNVLRPSDRVWQDGEPDSDFAATVDGIWTTGSVPGTVPPQQDALPKVVWLLGIGIWIVAAAMACYALSGRMLASSLTSLHMVPTSVTTTGQQAQKQATVEPQKPTSGVTVDSISKTGERETGNVAQEDTNPLSDVGEGKTTATPQRSESHEAVDVIPKTGRTKGDSSPRQRTVDLLSLVREAKTGTVDDNGLTLGPSEPSTGWFEFPYDPPEEYDLEFTYTRRDEAGKFCDFVVIFPKGGVGYSCAIRRRAEVEWGRDVGVGFFHNDDRILLELLPKTLQQCRTFTILLQVRTEGAKILVNGELSSSTNGYVDLAKAEEKRRLAFHPGPYRTVIHAAQVKEVSGSSTP